ncbi:MAG: hypothetical protein MUD01_03205 [Chloroflexaceae bacterium]|jgi:hypothetical protein|nr:hypothetical protein [Chloroflexaceae bacterium]
MRSWLNRVALSLLLALLVGGLSYLLARAATTGYLLYQQQQYFTTAADVVRGGDIEALGASNLRELRLLVRALDAQYTMLSAQIGFAGAAVAAVASYLWLERRDGGDGGKV